MVKNGERKPLDRESKFSIYHVTGYADGIEIEHHLLGGLTFTQFLPVSELKILKEEITEYLESNEKQAESK